MIPKSMPSGFDPMGGNRFSEKHALGLDPGDHAQTKKLERDADRTTTHPALGMRGEPVAHLHEGAEALGVGTTDLKRIEVVGAPVESAK